MRDADFCAAITKRHARTFTLAAAMLPRDKRRGAFALYAFCRQADDIVDRGVAGDQAAGSALVAYRAQLDAAVSAGASDAVFREVAWTIDRFAVPAAPLFALIDGVARDLAPLPYATWRDLEEYCAAVASTVGEMCTHVFGVQDGSSTLASALHRARSLGIAMQLTNILRDVGEDAVRGRCYLPNDDLATFGLSRHDVLTNADLARDARWRSLMQFEIARARGFYDDAAPGIGMLARDARSCAAACARGYAEILTAIEARRYDTIRARAVVAPWRRASVLWNAWRLRTA